MEAITCLICTVPIRFTRLGAAACRACAAFFKRTKISGKIFTCRQGEGKCVIRKHEKYMCRSCRYDQCVSSGMSYDILARNEAVLAVEQTPPASTSADDGEGSPSESLIDRMGEEYKASVERRIVLEKDYAVNHDLKPFNHPSEEFFVCDFVSTYELFRMAIKESTSLLPNVFDDFEDLSIDNRVALFKNFYIKFCVIEGVYLTSKYFKNTTIFMFSLITVADVSNLEQELLEDATIPQSDTFRSEVSRYTAEYYDTIGLILEMDGMTERELHALALLSYCDVETCSQLPDEIIDKAAQTRAIVFAELQEYYRYELKLQDISQRLGYLMTIAHLAAEAGVLLIEEMRMYATMFGIYSEDQFFREFIRE